MGKPRKSVTQEIANLLKRTYFSYFIVLSKTYIINFFLF